MKVSIIIPVRKINDYIIESITHINKQTYKNFEVIIFPDDASNDTFPNTKIIPTGNIGPAEKRDLALKYAKGEILAFLDDDAYPRKDWLANAIPHFKDNEIAGVGGPGVTPNSNSLLQKASGGVFETLLGGGSCSYRYIPKNKRFVDDFPSVNLLIRFNIFKEIGGFDSHYYPGEDTKLCRDITIIKKKKIIYDPEVFVWHHRRKLFIPHLKQIGNYAIHRGKFIREFPETSLKLSYLIPSIFLIFVLGGGILTLINFPYAKHFYITILSVYLTFLFLDVLRFKSIKLSTLVALGIISTHIWYGFQLLRGLFKKHLVR